MNLYLVHFTDNELNYYAVAHSMAQVEKNVPSEKAASFVAISLAGSEDAGTVQLLGWKTGRVS